MGTDWTEGMMNLSLPSTEKEKKSFRGGVVDDSGEIFQRLRALVTLPEDLGLVLITCAVVHKHLHKPSFRRPSALF